MDLRDYLRTARRRWRLILICAIGAVAVGVVATLLATPQYQATARLFVTTATAGPDDSSFDAYQGGLFSQQRVASYADLVGGRELAASVAKDLDLELTPDELAANVTALSVPNSVILDITYTDPSPRRAQAIAQAYAVALTEMVRELETQPGSDLAPIKATVVDPATLPAVPSSPNVPRNLALALGFGLVLGIAAAILRELLDFTVKTQEDLEGVAAPPLLGTVPYDAGIRTQPLVTSLSTHSPRAEAFRVLRTNLQFVDVDVPDKVFVVTSAVPEEGKTTTSVNLAITMARAGLRTLLVEGDLRRPKASATLGLDHSIGVTTVLLGRVALRDAVQTHAESGLNVLASGAVPPNPAELLQSNAMAELLKQVRVEYDVVVVDAPPLLPVTDAALLAVQADGAIVVVRHGKTTRDQVTQALQRISQVGARSVGVVLNMSPTRRGGNSYGYGYGYGYAPDAPDNH